VAAQAGDPIGQWAAAKRAASAAILAGAGTITHHHAVGLDHRDYLTAEIGELGVTVLRAVKSALDPAGIMNPGKLIPPAD
jgi:alkyldihydroxyacetonephosphate synthase